MGSQWFLFSRRQVREVLGQESMSGAPACGASHCHSAVVGRWKTVPRVNEARKNRALWLRRFPDEQRKSRIQKLSRLVYEIRSQSMGSLLYLVYKI